MKLLWCVLCSRIITDSATNSTSYIDCLEEIQAIKLPANIPNCSIGSLWEKSQSDSEEGLKVRVFVEHPSGKSEQLIETDNLKLSKERHRLNFTLDGFLINEEGKYSFKLERWFGGKWDCAAELTFRINLIKPNDQIKV